MLSYRYEFEAVGVVAGEEVVFDRAEFNIASEEIQPMVEFFEVEMKAFFDQVDREFGERTYERVNSFYPIPADEVDLFISSEKNI